MPDRAVPRPATLCRREDRCAEPSEAGRPAGIDLSHVELVIPLHQVNIVDNFHFRILCVQNFLVEDMIEEEDRIRGRSGLIFFYIIDKNEDNPPKEIPDYSHEQAPAY